MQISFKKRAPNCGFSVLDGKVVTMGLGRHLRLQAEIYTTLVSCPALRDVYPELSQKITT